MGIWYYIYLLDAVWSRPGLYYVTRHAKDRDKLIEGLPTSCGDRRKKWFFFDVATCGSGLRRHFNMTHVFQSLLVSIDSWSAIWFLTLGYLFCRNQPPDPPTDEEIKEIKAVFSLRSYIRCGTE